MKKKAFTLAEVLMCLGIIGVVSAVSIPIVHTSTKERHFASAKKKAKVLATDAWEYATARGDISHYADTIESEHFDSFKSYFSIAKDNGTSFKDKSGFSWWYGENNIWVDINGDDKGPNNEGDDQLSFCLNTDTNSLDLCTPGAEEEEEEE